MSELNYGELKHGVSNFCMKLQQFKNLKLPCIVVVVVFVVVVVVVVVFCGEKFVFGFFGQT